MPTAAKATEEEPVVEIGVQYPDGTTNWSTELKIWSPEDRAQFVAARNRQLELLGVAKDPGVKFVTRTRTITYSETTELAG